MFENLKPKTLSYLFHHTNVQKNNFKLFYNEVKV